MTVDKERIRQDLVHFLRTIQKPGKPVDNIGLNDGLVSSGLIDSLAIIQIVSHLEQTYNIDFAARGVDPERLSSIASIIDLVAEASA
jgi:acyl carrier protein